MRAINENTLAILKSQRMIEQDRFSYELKLERYEESYGDIIDTFNTTVVNDVDHADFAIRSDGKVLFIYSLGNTIYSKVIDSESEMLSTSGAGNDGTLLMTFTARVDRKNFAIYRMLNSKLLLVVIDKGIAASSLPYTVKAYISDNGLGTDFELLSTIHSFHTTGLNEAYLKTLVSPITQDNDGNLWFACSSSVDAYSGYARSKLTVYKSTNGGQTWAAKYVRDNHMLFYDEMSSFVAIGNTRFVILTDSYGVQWDVHIWISTDNGDTWTEISPAFSGLPYTTTGRDDHAALSMYSDRFGTLYMVLHPTVAVTANAKTLDLYTAKPSGTADYNYLNNISNWAKIKEGIPSDPAYWQKLSISPNGTIHVLQRSISNEVNNVYDIGMTREIYSADFHASSISISKGRGGANTMSIAVDNNEGSLNPKNPDSPLYGILNLNKQIIVKMGYGSDLIEVFTGLIDEFSMKSHPHLMDISCRDLLKKALDQTITEGSQQTVAFTNTAIESIFGYLCYLGGIETGTIEATGINISKIFSWQSYADAFQFLADLASFEYGADEYGKIYFRRDYQPNNMSIAYTFEEGVDITSMSYKLSDDDLYYRVKAYGKSGNTVLVYDAPFVDAAKYNILPQKILKVDATEASTVSELRTIAERALYLMNSRTAIVEFEAIAVPWLQVGDFIQVYERSSMSTGIYRISSMTLNLTPKRFTMRLSCYYYGDSIVIGELPTETATQTADPNLNLIPEMTSNTAPSGVARASSIYNGTYEPWQALNSTSDDYYWNSIAATGWIEYQFTELTIVDKYMLKARQALEYNDAMPKNFTFEAFDGSVWVVLDTRTNQTAWGINEQRQYLFANTKAYIKYRLNVSANNGYSRLQLEQLAMYYGGGS